ncbi:site-specific integrase [Virgisporangium aurantiacum]|nr:site-specific integrase [Virgisporangium aurantiacum]
MAAYPVSDAGVVSSDQLVLRAAVAAYLGRYRGQTRLHTNSDLRIFLRWCEEQSLEPLAAVRTDVERYVRWLQDIRRFQPSTVSRRLSIVVGFYRVCVIDGLLSHSPADYVRRPPVPAESPTPRAWSSAVRGADHHRPAVDQPERLRPGRTRPLFWTHVAPDGEVRLDMTSRLALGVATRTV